MQNMDSIGHRLMVLAAWPVDCEKYLFISYFDEQVSCRLFHKNTPLLPYNLPRSGSKIPLVPVPIWSYLLSVLQRKLSPIKAAWMFGIALCLIAIILLVCKVFHLSTHHICMGTLCYWCAFPSVTLQYVWNNSEGNNQPTQPHLKSLFRLLLWDLIVTIVLCWCRCLGVTGIRRRLQSKTVYFMLLPQCKVGSIFWQPTRLVSVSKIKGLCCRDWCFWHMQMRYSSGYMGSWK